jgi:heterodisulfide reductase subunit B/NAD-dependent dihydropyrimidine dehydrogenase PreA subunit
MVLDLLGVRYKEIEGFTCCPEQFLVETLSEEAWYLTAARNLALAEQCGGDLLVACNGCYSTFRSAISAFNGSSKLRSQVRERLAEIGLEYNFRSSVYHVIEVLHDKVGPDLIRGKVTDTLDGLQVAVHYGCQLLRPTPVVRVDDPLRPDKLDRLVECLGANSVDYDSKMTCCGESLARSGCPEESMWCARMKLLELEELGADALVVTCPACFQQFDTQQALMRRDKGDLDVPIFYYTELLGLALGLGPEEIGLEMHRTSVESFLERWDRLKALRASVPDEFDFEMMRTCVGCESCMNDCPVSQMDEAFLPHEVIRRILSGELEYVLRGEDIWKCLECGTCQELCPNNFGMIKVFKQAKRMALSQGVAPPETRQGIEMFRQSGVLGKARERARAKLGLGPVAAPGGEELARLLRETFSGKDE